MKECKVLPSGGLDSLLDEDCCLSLSKPHRNGETNECTLRLSTRLDIQRDPRWNPSHGSPIIYQMDPKIQRKVLNSVLIVSEARLIEVFKGQHEEYYKTVQGELLAEVEESKLFRSIIAFDKCEESITLKFKNFSDSNSLWIYAIYASTEIVTDTDGFGKPTRFSGKHLTSVLEKHNITISDEASKFRNILESFNNDNSCRVRVNDKDPVQMMMMMGAMVGMHSGSRNDFPLKKSSQNPSLLCSGVDYENMPKKQFLDPLFRSNTPGDSNICSERRYSVSSQTESCSGESTLSDTSLDGDDTIAKSPIKITTTENNVHNNKKVYADDNMEKFMGKMQSYLKEENNEVDKDKLNFLLGLHPSKDDESKDKKINETKITKGKPEELRLLETKLPCLKNVESQFSVIERIESVIDNKITAMEKRLLRKIDDTFREKQREDNERFDRLESMLIQLMEKQMQNKS